MTSFLVDRKKKPKMLLPRTQKIGSSAMRLKPQNKKRPFALLCTLILGMMVISFVNTLVASRSKGNPTEFYQSQKKLSPIAVENVDECAKFDHGDTSPATNVSSIFNCGSPAGRCVWYHPAKFFDADCGVGKKYRSSLDDMEEMRKNKTLWARMPLIILPWASLGPGMKQSNYRNETFPQHNISMTHIHKTGGTSLVAAFAQLKSFGAKTYRYTVYFHGRPDSLNERYRNTSSAFLDGAVKYQSVWGESEHTLLGVVRDPAERFISAIGQAAGAAGSSRNNGVGAVIRDKCIKDTPKETLRCCINLVKNNSTWVEIHFTPMVLEVSFATMYKDIPVAIFPFKEVPTLMYEVGADPHSKKKDGSAPGFRADAVLTNMTIKDYDVNMLDDLCKIYEMDIIFLRHIGYATRCDPFISFE